MIHGGLLAMPRRAEPCRGDGRARHRRHRPGRRQSLSVRSRSSPRARIRRDHREYRHRRPGHDPRGGQEPRLCRRRDRSGRLRRRACGNGGQRRRDTRDSRSRLAAQGLRRAPPAYDAAIAGWFAGQSGETMPGHGCRYRPAARRSCATAKTRTSRPRFYRTAEAPARRRQRRARCRARNSSYNNHQRHRCRVRTGQPSSIRQRPGGRHHQARQSLRRRRRRDARRCLSRRRCAAIRSRAFGGIVAVNRPLDAAAAAAMVEIFTEVVIAPDADEDATRHRRERRICACCSPAPCRDRGAGGAADHARIAGGLPGAGPRQRHDRATPISRCVTKRAPDERELADLLFALRGRQAREVERHRLRQGRRHGGHRRRPDEPGRFGPHRRHARPRRRPKRRDWPSRWPRDRSSPPTPSSPSPTGC